MELTTIIEIISVFLSLLFLVLLIKEVVWCWPFGILSSALSIYLFIDAKLYSEAILYLFYVGVGVYGWYAWTKKGNGDESSGMRVKSLPWQRSLALFSLGLLGAVGLGYLFQKSSDAVYPYADATTTSFSIVASFLEAHKAIASWIYWIAINGVSVWLYFDRGLPIYSMLMVVYFLVSVYGYFDWKKKLETSST